MADGYTELNPGQGGDVMDEEVLTYGSAPTIRKRPRVVITGADLDDIARVMDSAPTGSEYGMVVRNIPSGTQTVSGDVNALVRIPGTPISVYSTTTLVPSNTETTVCQYVVPTGFTFHAVGFAASGTVNGLFKLYIDTNIKIAGRNSVAYPTLDLDFNYVFPTATQGLIVKVTVIHQVSGVNADFEGTILGYIT